MEYVLIAFALLTYILIAFALMTYVLIVFALMKFVLIAFVTMVSVLMTIVHTFSLYQVDKSELDDEAVRLLGKMSLVQMWSHQLVLSRVRQKHSRTGDWLDNVKKRN
jgi:hypothetical protein